MDLKVRNRTPEEPSVRKHEFKCYEAFLRGVFGKNGEISL